MEGIMALVGIQWKKKVQESYTYFI